MSQIKHQNISVESKNLRENEKHRRTELILNACLESPKDMIILALDKEFNYLYFNKTHELGMKSAYGVVRTSWHQMLQPLSITQSALLNWAKMK